MFYHLSDTWAMPVEFITPRLGRVDDPNCEKDTIPFIAVAPSIPQAVIAIGRWWEREIVNVYQTNSQTAKPADWVFDFDITEEHRFYEETKFNRICSMDMNIFLREGAVAKDIWSYELKGIDMILASHNFKTIHRVISNLCIDF